MLLMDFISQGGPVMYLLFGCSVFAGAIVLERTSFWFRESKNLSVKQVQAVLRQLKRGEALRPQDYLSESVVQRIIELTEGTNSEGALADRIADLLGIESDRAYERASRHLTGLETVVSIAPLLGILGTVLGIMKSFRALDLGNVASASVVGVGLAEALITTAAGLVIAVPALVMYNFFSSLAGRHAAALQKCAEDFLLEESVA